MDGSLHTERDILLSKVRAFTQTTLAEQAESIDVTDQISPELFKEFARQGLFAIDATHGGEDIPNNREWLFTMLAILEEISRVSPSAAKAVMDQNFGQIAMVRNYASPELRDKILGDLRSGSKMAAFLMTEPQSGSDIKKFTTTASKVQGGYVISGTKDWITGAADRKIFAIVAKPSPESTEVGLFIVDRTEMTPESGTIEITDRKDKLGLRGLGEFNVSLKNVFVPDNQVLLDFDRASLGRIMKHYNVKRLGQSAIVIGLSKAAMQSAYDYSVARFPTPGTPPRFNLDATLAPLFGELKAAETLMTWATEQLANGDLTGVPSSMSKYFSTELAVRITNACCQLCGGNGYSKKLPIERLMRDARMLTMAGGASEVLRGTIARNLGALLAAA